MGGAGGQNQAKAPQQLGPNKLRASPRAANQQATTNGVLSGTASIVFSAAGLLQGKPQRGTVFVSPSLRIPYNPLQFTSTRAGYVSAQYLAGSASFSFGASGTLSPGLGGNATIVFAASGILSYSQSGTASMVFGAYGTATGSVIPNPPGTKFFPQVVGLELIPAAEALLAAGFYQMPQVIQIPAPVGTPPGLVLAQQPPAGSYQLTFVSITLTVARGVLPAFRAGGVIPWNIPP